jgi:phospholipid/cholesterol/gamma-HCH transport system permease protein
VGKIRTGLSELGGITAIALDGTLSLRKRPFQYGEFIRQCWFITKVSALRWC